MFRMFRCTCFHLIESLHLHEIPIGKWHSFVDSTNVLFGSRGLQCPDQFGEGKIPYAWYIICWFCFWYIHMLAMSQAPTFRSTRARARNLTSPFTETSNVQHMQKLTTYVSGASLHRSYTGTCSIIAPPPISAVLSLWAPRAKYLHSAPWTKRRLGRGTHKYTLPWMDTNTLG